MLEELLKRLKRERLALRYFDIRQIVVPDAFGWLPLSEEQEIRLYASTSTEERARRQAHNTPEVALIQQLTLCLHERFLISAEQHALINNHAATTAFFKAVDDMLEEEHLRRACLVRKLRLRFLTLLAAERWVSENNIVQGRGVGVQPAVDLVPCQRVTVPDAIHEPVRFTLAEGTSYSN